LIVADSPSVSSQALANLRIRLGAELKQYDPATFHYSWVVRFPLLHWDEEEKRYAAFDSSWRSPSPTSSCRSAAATASSG
ncbi:MAG TPA: hypothetical protein VLM40_09275, partial [Gemmata sp.]|nr:hypothetical protein [Gemmata sp.]